MEKLVAILSEAIRQRSPVQLTYRGVPQKVCPYRVGYSQGEERAFVLAIERSPRGTPKPAENWVCLRVSDVEDIKMVDEPWRHAKYPGVVLRCVDDVRVAVDTGKS